MLRAKGYKQSDQHRERRLAWMRDVNRFLAVRRKGAETQRGVPRPSIAGKNHPNYGNIGHLSNTM